MRILIAACYRAAYLLHHKLFLRKGKPLQHSKLVVVGSYLTGGAGKTPFCMWLADHVASGGKKVAILCHPYAYDEAEMLRRRFAGHPLVQVVVTGNRYRTARKLDRTRQFGTILCDDGFEDSRLAGATFFVLLWGKPPTQLRDLWPIGKNRSLRKDHGSVIELQCSGAAPDIRFVLQGFSNQDRVQPGSPRHPTGDYRQVNLFCGVGDPVRFLRDVQSVGIKIQRSIFRRDHDRNFAKAFAQELANHRNEDYIISQKDAARLPDNFAQKSQVFIANQTIVLNESILSRVDLALKNSP
ncbi:tetraacyldisaccharide 4'-kinase [uncultured Fibrobacter sp.]|uniref:tetraacyldisaccharide 4'-kinase n=1 Tax=uncultured Fibrobacter sp. TaxID=261512 RepID=UPI0026065D41|nr:tetraacyldisaccharide 4'-kinase [uncultured Fibrobacter sp.]